MDTRELPESVNVGAKKAWRPSNGKIVRGREEDKTLEEREAILGYLRHIHVFYGTTKEGQDYGKLEAVLETRNGLEVFGTNIMNTSSGKPTISSSVTFALALLDCAKGELVQINANKGKEKNGYGTFSTYVNVTGIDPVTLAPGSRKGLTESGQDRPQWDADYLDSLLDQLMAHPAYSERSGSATDGGPSASAGETDVEGAEYDPFAEE